MNPNQNERTERIERLISRFLDDEALAIERAELQREISRDPTVGALLDDHAALDREVRCALRRQFGRPIVDRHAPSRWRSIARVLGIAAAAGLATLLWFQPPRDATLSADPGMRAGSWFAAPPQTADELLTDNLGYERPLQREADAQRRWILIPTDRPGEYLLIQIDETQTRTTPLQGDF